MAYYQLNTNQLVCTCKRAVGCILWSLTFDIRGREEFQLNSGISSKNLAMAVAEKQLVPKCHPCAAIFQDWINHGLGLQRKRLPRFGGSPNFGQTNRFMSRTLVTSPQLHETYIILYRDWCNWDSGLRSARIRDCLEAMEDCGWWWVAIIGQQLVCCGRQGLEALRNFHWTFLNNFEHFLNSFFFLNVKVKCPSFIEFRNRDILPRKMGVSPNNHEIQ